MKKTAAELMAELANDKQHQAKKKEKEQKISELQRICESDEKDLVLEINRTGFSVKSVWDFVNSENDYLKAVPVLIKHLKIKHHPKILAGIARSLAMPVLIHNEELWLLLVKLYIDNNSPLLDFISLIGDKSQMLLHCCQPIVGGILLSLLSHLTPPANNARSRYAIFTANSR